MLRNILMWLFTNSQSRVDRLVFTIALVYAINSKYKKSLLVMLIGYLLVMIMELLLGI